MMNHILKQQITELVELEDEEYDLVSKYFTEQKFRKRQFVIQENQPVDKMFFVVDGLLKSSLIDNTGKERILQFAIKDWWISDFQAYFKRERSTLAIQCLEDSVLIGITFDNFEKVCKKFPLIEHFFRVKSNIGYAALQKRIISLLTLSAKERYEAFVIQYPILFPQISKQHIANYLGVTRETLSRLEL